MAAAADGCSGWCDSGSTGSLRTGVEGTVLILACIRFIRTDELLRPPATPLMEPMAAGRAMVPGSVGSPRSPELDMRREESESGTPAKAPLLVPPQPPPQPLPTDPLCLELWHDDADSRGRDCGVARNWSQNASSSTVFAPVFSATFGTDFAGPIASSARSLAGRRRLAVNTPVLQHSCWQVALLRQWWPQGMMGGPRVDGALSPRILSAGWLSDGGL